MYCTGIYCLNILYSSITEEKILKKAEKEDEVDKNLTFRCMNPTDHQPGNANPAKGNLKFAAALDLLCFAISKYTKECYFSFYYFPRLTFKKSNVL